MLIPATERLHSLRVKILGSLFLIFATSMGVALFGMWNYQRDKLIDMNRQKADEAGHIIEASLRASMLREDRQAIQETIEAIRASTQLSRISIMNTEGRIILSSDPDLKGLSLDKNQDPTCTICHRPADSSPGREAVVVESPEGSFLRSVIKIANRPACFGCHPEEQKLCGMLVVDSFLADMYGLLTTVANRTALTGILTFLVIVGFISFIVARFVTNPVQAFMNSIKDIERGDFNSWVDVKGSGEFAEMAVSFNVMTKAIGRYIEEVRSKRNEISTLYTIVKKMSETIELKKVKGIVVSLLCEVLDVESIVLVLPGEGDPERLEILWKKRQEKYYQSDYFIGSPAAPHQSLSKEELSQWLAAEHPVPDFVDRDVRVLLPLQLKDMKLGLIAALKGDGQRFTRAEKKLVPAIARHIAISFANARLYNLAITDELTGLYTKRFFQSKIKDLEELSHLTGEEFCVMMLDLDFFKEVNDTYGHPIGDQVLVKVAELIRANLRHGDIPCRYGGEEFVVLLPGSDINSARAIADRLRTSIATHTFRFEDHPPFSRTVSIGLSCCPLHASSAEQLVMTADAALYTAKRGGRNQVHIISAARLSA